MIHHVLFFQLKTDTDAETVESMVRNSRSLLLKIPEVLNVRSGRNLEADAQWPFFISIEVDSLEKLRATRDNAQHLKLMEAFIRPHITAEMEMNFELDPSKNLKYS